MLAAFRVNECLEPQWIQESRDITRQVIEAIFDVRVEKKTPQLINGYSWIERVSLLDATEVGLKISFCVVV